MLDAATYVHIYIRCVTVCVYLSQILSIILTVSRTKVSNLLQLKVDLDIGKANTNFSFKHFRITQD